MAAVVWSSSRAASVVAPGDGGGPLYLTRRGRAVVLALAIAVMVALAIVVAGRASASGAGGSAVEVERHVVVPGETMWGIADTVARPGQDVRDVVLELVRLNELPNAGLMAGQTIVVPRR